LVRWFPSSLPVSFVWHPGEQPGGCLCGWLRPAWTPSAAQPLAPDCLFLVVAGWTAFGLPHNLCVGRLFNLTFAPSWLGRPSMPSNPSPTHPTLDYWTPCLTHRLATRRHPSRPLLPVPRFDVVTAVGCFRLWNWNVPLPWRNCAKTFGQRPALEPTPWFTFHLAARLTGCQDWWIRRTFGQGLPHNTPTPNAVCSDFTSTILR